MLNDVVAWHQNTGVLLRPRARKRAQLHNPRAVLFTSAVP